MKVPFLDLELQYETIKEEITTAIQRVMQKTAFAGGPFVAAFEEEFASFCGTDHAVGVSSGTDALWLALLALGVGPRDEVITVPNTFIATAEAITRCGAKPVFVDVDDQSYTMNPILIEGAITRRTKAIIPVHLFGQTADMDPIMEVARKHRLFVIEDACQAHGALYKGRSAGSMGDAGCFSFYPGKNLGACGEAGAIVTNSARIADEARTIRDHGQAKKYHHDVIGWNSRMDGIQGAILSVKLKYLPEWNESRRRNAYLYDELLAEVEGIITPKQMDLRRHVFHIYAVRTRSRDAFIKALATKDISCGIHYPVPVHLQNAYRGLGLKQGSFPTAERCAEEFVSLPMFPEMTWGQIRHVVSEIKSYMADQTQGDEFMARRKIAR